MITPDGWLDWAERAPGPPDKVYSTANAAVGYVPHSAVGFYGGWESRLFSTDRRPDGRYTSYASASVHGWIAYDGSVKQHYPFTASCWASGSSHPNTNFIAFENEGGFQPTNEQLTPAQVASNVRIIRELAAWRGWTGFRRPGDDADRGANLYEHCECVRFGSEPTLCASARIPWEQIMASLNGSTPPPPPPPPPPGHTVVVRFPDGSAQTIDVDEYVRGVVPYEMGTGWPAEALKAQAVVAKSYALAAREVFTDTRSQVYGPLRHADTDAAVEAVRGVYLGFGGDIVMPFYFGHCTGNTRSPSQAGWNPVADRAFLQGVACPCGRTAYFGHGIGMCQRGAQTLAQQGKTYDEILRHYYTGIELLGFGSQRPEPIPPASTQTYVCESGDTLISIAARFGLDWPALFTMNRAVIADPNILMPGLMLIVPKPPVEDGEVDVYVVQPGDTLFAIARKWETTVAAISGKNAIENPSLIRPGQRLMRP